MATNHRGQEVHAGKRTRDQYPHLTRAIARMERRDGITDSLGTSWNTGWVPSTSRAMDMGEALIDQYNRTRDVQSAQGDGRGVVDPVRMMAVHKASGEKIGRAFKERGLPDSNARDDS